MMYRLLLLTGVASTALYGATLPASADNYGGTQHYDSQAGETRDLNNESLRRAQEDREDANDDDDDDDNAAAGPDDDDDADDNDDGDDGAAGANDDD